MNCPKCNCEHNRKNGIKRGRQNYICCHCGRQFIRDYEPTYSKQLKEECIQMYLNGIGFRAISRVNNVHNTTIITWVKQLGKSLPDAVETWHCYVFSIGFVAIIDLNYT